MERVIPFNLPPSSSTDDDGRSCAILVTATNFQLGSAVFCRLVWSLWCSYRCGIIDALWRGYDALCIIIIESAWRVRVVLFLSFSLCHGQYI